MANGKTTESGREILLVDNGSVRAEAVQALRRVAEAAGRAVGRKIRPVGLLHSHRAPPEDLGGEPAETLEPCLRRLLGEGRRRFFLQPFFLGPSRAVTAYMPERLAVLQRTWPDLEVTLGEVLAGPGPEEAAAVGRLVRAVADRVEEALGGAGEERGGGGTGRAGERLEVILVDHGSPEPAVGAVRTAVGAALAGLPGWENRRVVGAAMERREGPEYDFNEPLLERALGELVRGPEVVVAQLFLLPGRHAGPGGDIAGIVERARATRPELRVRQTAPLGEHAEVLALLAEKLRRAGA